MRPSGKSGGTRKPKGGDFGTLTLAGILAPRPAVLPLCLERCVAFVVLDLLLSGPLRLLVLVLAVAFCAIGPMLLRPSLSGFSNSTTRFCKASTTAGASCFKIFSHNGLPERSPHSTRWPNCTKVGNGTLKKACPANVITKGVRSIVTHRIDPMWPTEHGRPLAFQATAVGIGATTSSGAAAHSSKSTTTSKAKLLGGSNVDFGT